MKSIFVILCVLVMSTLCNTKEGPCVTIMGRWDLEARHFKVMCEGVNMPINSRIDLYDSGGHLYATSSTSSVNTIIQLDKNTITSSFYCIAQAMVDGDIKTIRSAYIARNRTTDNENSSGHLYDTSSMTSVYTIVHLNGNTTTRSVYCKAQAMVDGDIKTIRSPYIPRNRITDNENSMPEETIIEPFLNNITLYRSGDNFSHTCKGRNFPKATTFTWTKIKDGQNISLIHRTSVTELSLNTVLTERDNNSRLQCTLSYYDIKLECFIEKSIATVLILEQGDQVESIMPSISKYPNYLFLLLGILILFILIGIIVFGISRYKAEKKLYVEVINDLYGSDSSVVYSQVYSEPLEYAQIIDNYQPKK